MTLVDGSNCRAALDSAAAAQKQWARLSVRQRGLRMHAVQTRIAQVADDLCDLVTLPQRRSKTETLSAELIPLCEALRYLQRDAAKVLATRKLPLSGRPLWLWGTRAEVQRVALGRVLIIAPWNYPLFLAGVQAAQALVAGNAVLLKPAPGCEAATATLVDCFQAAVGTDLIRQVGSDPEVATRLIQAGVEKVVLTGSSTTGRRVGSVAADALTPATMELSGCDAMVVLPEADRARVVESLLFGLSFNSGATCIAPRRIFLCQRQSDHYRKLLKQRLVQMPSIPVHPAVQTRMIEAVEDAIARGARVVGGLWDREAFERTGATPPLVLFGAQPDWPIMSADLFAPLAAVCDYASPDDLVDLVARAPYALAASIFGPQKEARQLADLLDVGTVTINDLIVPTADPRIPFGGRRASGFGTTRGAEGLLAMTCPRVIATQRLRHPKHLAAPTAGDEAILAGLLQLKFAAGWRLRLRGLGQMVRGIRQSRNNDSR
ncbi:NAD/NADP-dependent betaine aldehyde dehydrogenase [Rosistilla oblonga]|uniref:aldehyde dehydrogenase family protein n=1 Tax=Rosistilla oblonga TaxID=2527990 RepID=UPI00118CC9B6|nr:aldehyde dehydrogenase family protein [Rosistilla oblonga]QDV13573.1 NAD/NADP-dependent betaine aldehyde dehydrogenase [Rosistilla oblonga]